VAEAPAPGWAELMQRCWDDAPDMRPAFHDVVSELEGMLRAAKLQRQQAQAAGRVTAGPGASGADVQQRSALA
jgi:hypothetical protein